MPPTATADRDRQHRQTQKGRSATRVLSDYTLTKTLGTGSMGKVKLAIGEFKPGFREWFWTGFGRGFGTGFGKF